MSYMVKRLLFRIQPIEHIRKRQRRRKEMKERRKQFEDFLKDEILGKKGQ